MREYEFKCQKCGKVWYATDKDIRDSNKLKYSVGQAKIQRFSLIHGEKYTRNSEKIAQMQMADRDPERCPNCGSRQVERTEDEFNENDSSYGGNKFLIGLVAFLMPYVGFFLVLFKKPFSRKANKWWLVYCVAMSVTVFAITGSNFSKQNDADAVNANPIVTDSAAAPATNMSDIKTWYENNSDSVATKFEDYLNNETITVTDAEYKIANTDVSEIKFMFGDNDGWYECHYVTYFTCKVGDMDCSGHARGFVKYGSDAVTWWSLEIDHNNTALIDEYNDEYDTIIEDYYKELESTYAAGGK